MKNLQCRVLLTDANHRNTLAAVRALGKAGATVDVVGSPHALSSYSRYTRKLAFSEGLFNAAHLPEVEKLLRSEKYDVLLPIGAKSVRFCAEQSNLFKQYVALALPPLASVEQCLNKQSLNEFAKTLGVAVPASWPLRNAHDVDRVCQVATFPAVLKGQNELDAGAPLYVTTARDLAKTYQQWQAMQNAGHSESWPILQEQIFGDGYGFFALYDQGVIKQIFMHHRLREVPATGGASCCAESVYEEELHRSGKALLDALNWHGVAMVEFKRSRQDGKFYLMEINPKFWGSLDLAITAGANFPVLAVQLALGEILNYNDSYRRGLRFHWPLGSGELKHLRQRPQSFWAILADSLNPWVRSNIQITDPLPSIWLLRSDLRGSA